MSGARLSPRARRASTRKYGSVRSSQRLRQTDARRRRRDVLAIRVDVDEPGRVIQTQRLELAGSSLQHEMPHAELARLLLESRQQAAADAAAARVGRDVHALHFGD